MTETPSYVDGSYRHLLHTHWLTGYSYIEALDLVLSWRRAREAQTDPKFIDHCDYMIHRYALTAAKIRRDFQKTHGYGR